MNYKLTKVNDGNFEMANCGYSLYKDGNDNYYSVFNHNGKPDPTTWASLLPYSYERDMPIFTREYCDYQGIKIKEYDTITII